MAWLLRKMEKCPTSLFRRKELLKRSNREFEKLNRRGFLRYSQASPYVETYPCDRADCVHACPREVVEKRGRFFAVCPENIGVAPVPLAEDDISRYSFSLETLVKLIRGANGFDGESYPLSPRLYFMGEKIVEGAATAFVLALFPTIKAAEPHLLSLIALLPACYELIVVVTPALNLTQEGIYSKLLAVSIFPLVLSAHFSKRDFRISYLSAIRRRRPAGASPAMPSLTEKQLSDYEKYGYKCRDRLHIPGEFPMKRQNLIILNGNRIKLGDSLFSILMRFVVELKKGNGGWVHMSDLVTGGFINDHEHRQPFSNLRTALKGSLLEKDGQKFLESSGAKEYRLSTHPACISFNKDKLLHNYDEEVRKSVKQL